MGLSVNNQHRDPSLPKDKAIFWQRIRDSGECIHSSDQEKALYEIKNSRRLNEVYVSLRVRALRCMDDGY
jgi:hypothetical protein